MNIKKSDLRELLEDVYRQGFTNGKKTNAFENDIHKKAVQISELREEYRIMKRTADQAEAKAATLEAMLDEEREKAKKNDDLFAKMARHNGHLHRLLQDAGIKAPTFSEALAAFAADDDESEGEE